MKARAFERLLDLGVRATDAHEARAIKRIQTGMAIASVPMVLGWGATFLTTGHPALALWHVGYALGTFALLLLFAVTKRYAWFSEPHIALVMLSPFALHWQLGGYRGSGGAFLWCLLGPVSAMMFCGARRSLVWFAVMIALAMAGFFCEGAPILTPSEITTQFAFNTVGFVAFLYLSTRYFVEQLEKERQRSERLLLNVLPRSIAERLKRDGQTIADRFESVTVLFADICGFTMMSQALTPHELVLMLDEMFSRFDDVADKHRLEKIKTIGDAYMMVGGLPEPSKDHAARVADAAFEMREIVRDVAKARGADLSMRIGIHSGEVVAGVIGRRKFTYDLWGDTVNTASRMESHGAPDRVHVSDAAKALLEAEFTLEDRGVLNVKGKGEMRTHWLQARRVP